MALAPSSPSLVLGLCMSMIWPVLALALCFQSPNVTQARDQAAAPTRQDKARGNTQIFDLITTKSPAFKNYTQVKDIGIDRKQSF